MQAKSKIKTEYDVPFDTPLCNGCLSTDRDLNVLGEYSEVFRQICPNIWVTQFYFCWECRAVMKRIKSFQLQVENAQNILKTCYNNLPKSLSNLSTVKPYVTDSNETIENENESEVTTDIQKMKAPKIDIKQETDDFGNDFDNFEYGPTCIEEIKDENLPDTILEKLKDITVKKVKQEHSDRMKRYKMIRQKIENVVKRIPIGETEIDAWLERERNSAYYNTLKAKCDKCVSLIRTNLRDHRRKFHSQSKVMQHICKVCECTFASESNLSHHMQQHYCYYCCELCGYKCYNKLHMSDHLKEHARVVQCLQCDATFNNTRKFFLHYKAIHCVFICDYCNKRYKTKSAIEGHMQRKHIKHKCNECDVTFSKYRTYRSHYLMKHRIERTEASYCVQCNLQFDTVPLFRRHINTSVAHDHERTNRPKKAVVQCPSCTNVYARKTTMMNHYRLVHLNKSNYNCDICEKSFLNRTKYKDHMMYFHEGREKQRNRICYICGRGFFNNRILSNHLRTHTGERPFECAYCDSSFGQKVALDSHVKFIHLKNKRKSDTNKNNLI